MRGIGHVAHRLHRGRPVGHCVRALAPPRAVRAAQAGSPLAQVPRVGPPRRRPPGRRLPPPASTLPPAGSPSGSLPPPPRSRWKGRRTPWAGPRPPREEPSRQPPPRSVKEAQHAIEQRTGIRRGATQVRRFLRRLGLQPRRVAAVPIPPRTTAADHAREQRQFLAGELEPVLAEARADRRDVYFVDGAHFVYAAFLGWVWCVARLFVRAASGRKRSNVLGAVPAVTHALIRVANHTYLNAESVCALLRAVAAAGGGRPITAVLDNA